MLCLAIISCIFTIQSWSSSSSPFVSPNCNAKAKNLLCKLIVAHTAEHSTHSDTQPHTHTHTHRQNLTRSLSESYTNHTVTSQQKLTHDWKFVFVFRFLYFSLSLTSVTYNYCDFNVNKICVLSVTVSFIRFTRSNCRVLILLSFALKLLPLFVFENGFDWFGLKKLWCFLHESRISFNFYFFFEFFLSAWIDFF